MAGSRLFAEANLCADLRVHITIQRANPFLKNLNVGRGQRDDLDFRWLCRRGLLFAAVGKQNQN